MDAGVVACLDKYNNDDFYVDISNILDDCFEYFILAHPKKKNLEETLDGHYIFHHGYEN